MAKGRKFPWRGLIIIGLIISGFIFGIKGCLSQFDERFAMPPALYFEKDGKGIILSIVQFQETNSYSSKGGVTHKSITAEYYLQTNDAANGARVLEKYICDHSDIEEYPVEAIGKAGDRAWLFIGEPVAFDPYTLEKVADIKTLEEKNPFLKGRLPKERRYYIFAPDREAFFITAKDGTKWILDAKTLAAHEMEGEETDPEKAETAAIDKIEEKARQLYDSVSVIPSRLFSEGKIKRDEYSRMQKEAWSARDEYYRLRDSLMVIKSKLRNKYRNIEDIKRRAENLHRANPGYSYMRSNQDTSGNTWFGLYSMKEMAGLYERVSFQSENEETERRYLFSNDYTVKDDGEAIIGKEHAAKLSDEGFLDGGFLLDKRTAAPVKPGGSYLIIHKNEVGQNGKIQLTRVAPGGRSLWSFNSELNEWSDWIFTGRHLIILGSGHEELSRNECNVLWCVDINSGKAVKYDFFEDK